MHRNQNVTMSDYRNLGFVLMSRPRLVFDQARLHGFTSVDQIPLVQVVLQEHPELKTRLFAEAQAAGLKTH